MHFFFKEFFFGNHCNRLSVFVIDVFGSVLLPLGREQVQVSFGTHLDPYCMRKMVLLTEWGQT